MISAAIENSKINRWYEKFPFEKSSIPREISFGMTKFTVLLNNAKPIRLNIINLYGFSTAKILGLAGLPSGIRLFFLFAIHLI